MEEYFKRFPIINYDGRQTINLTRNVKIIDTLFRIPYAFYPFEVEAGDRPDNIAYFAYKDPSVDWVLYLSNGVTDPYYDWYLDEEQFNSLLIKKYGSFEKSIKTILYYRTNWASDDRTITTSFYNNTLAPELKKYFAPIFGVGSSIISYERSKDDHTVNTNRILKLSTSFSSNQVFSNNEIVDFKFSNETVGSATVITSNATVTFVQHVSGEANTSMNIIGEESNAQASITQVDIVAQNITPLEETFWSPVTAFEYEREKNEKNKIINLMQPDYVLPLLEEMRTKLKVDDGSI